MAYRLNTNSYLDYKKLKRQIGLLINSKIEEAASLAPEVKLKGRYWSVDDVSFLLGKCS